MRSRRQLYRARRAAASAFRRHSAKIISLPLDFPLLPSPPGFLYSRALSRRPHRIPIWRPPASTSSASAMPLSMSSHAEEDFLAAHGLVKGAMTLIDAARAEA